MPRPPRMLLLGAGLSGGLLALALAELGVEVELAGGSLADSATGWSYGGVPWWAGAANPFGRVVGHRAAPLGSAAAAPW